MSTFSLTQTGQQVNDAVQAVHNLLSNSGSIDSNGNIAANGTIKSVVGTGAVELNGSDGSIEITRVPTSGSSGVGSGTGPFIDFKTSFNTPAEDFDCRIEQTDDDGLSFSTGGDGYSAKRVTILKGGNVGIGTINPSHKLEVIGDILINSGGADGGQLVLASQGFDTMQIDNERGSFRVVNQAGVGTELFTVSASGNVGIGSVDPSARLDVTGDIEYTGTITDTSDRRLKENINDLTGSLDKITQLSGKSYTMLDNEEGQIEFGFIAQEIKEVFPEVVKEIQKYEIDENGEETEEEVNYIGVSYVQLIAPMVEAIKELKSENESLKARVEALENA